jgi:hypothetical protein
LTPADRSAVEEEAVRLLDFVVPDGKPEIVWA